MLTDLFKVTLLVSIFFLHNLFAANAMEPDPYFIREKINKQIMSVEAPTPSVYSVQDTIVEREDRTTPIRIYSPSSNNHTPIILLMHGGAWVAGNLDTHDNLARYLCSETNAVVISIGYLNAPEGKFPLPLEQGYDTLSWTLEHASTFSWDTSKIAIVGDSAGGNMASALCLLIRDRQGPQFHLQVLINPAPELVGSDILQWQAMQYLSDLQEVNNPYVSPLLASDLSNLPPAIVILAEQDDLFDAGQRYADRLQTAGVLTQIYCQKGIGHLAGDGARASLKARESLNVAIEQIKKTFSSQ